MAATAGWPTILNVGGTPTAVTAQACTNTTGNSYQINTASRRVWDPSVTPIAYDGGVPATVSSVDYLFGIVTLAAPPGGAVTVDVTYIPLLDVAQGKVATMTIGVDVPDVSVFGSVDRAFITALRTLAAKFDTLDSLLTDLDSGAGTWKWDAKATSEILILVSIDWGGAGSNIYRFWAYINKTDVAAAVDALVTGAIELQATDVLAADGSRVHFSSGS